MNVPFVSDFVVYFFPLMLMVSVAGRAFPLLLWNVPVIVAVFVYCVSFILLIVILVVFCVTLNVVFVVVALYLAFPAYDTVMLFVPGVIVLYLRVNVPFVSLFVVYFFH